MAVCSAGHAQSMQPVGMEFGNIPDSLYQMQPPANNPDTPYVIANKEMKVSFENRNNSIIAILRYHVRLKVFDESAREASIISIPYYFDNDMEQISNIRAVTHLPSGKNASLSPDDIRTININSRYNVKEFTMPQVKDGAILEYSYVIHRRYIEELPDFFLANRVPTEMARVSITYPKYLRYDAFVGNFSGHVRHNFAYTDTSSVPEIFTIPQPKPIVTEQWTAYDIPAVEEEAFLSSLNDYRGKIKFLLSNFGIPRQYLENTWEVVVARMRKKTNPWNAIRSNILAESKGDSIANSLDTNSKKAIQDSIFRYVNETVNFSGANAPYSTETDTAVLRGRALDQAAINQTLIAMLRGAGIEANPLLISGRNSGKIDHDFPSFYQFNAQLVYSEIRDQAFVMDASFPHSQPGLIPVDMYNAPGLLLSQSSFRWVDFHPDRSTFDIQVDIEAELQSNGTLQGTVSSQQSGYPAQLIRQQIWDGNAEAEILRRALFDRFTQLTTREVSIKNINGYDRPIELSAGFEIENYATSFTDGLKFRPMIVGYQAENPFKDTNRKYPITLDAPEKLDVHYSITLPNGYAAEQGIQNRSLSMPGAQFREIYDMHPEQMEYEYHIDISRKEFSTDLFPQFYSLYQRWVDLSNTAWLLKD